MVGVGIVGWVLGKGLGVEMEMSRGGFFGRVGLCEMGGGEGEGLGAVSMM